MARGDRQTEYLIPKHQSLVSPVDSLINTCRIWGTNAKSHGFGLSKVTNPVIISFRIFFVANFLLSELGQIEFYHITFHVYMYSRPSAYGALQRHC